MDQQYDDWTKNISVSTKDDGTHLAITDPAVRSRLASAIKDGSAPLTLGSGKNRCVLEFGNQAGFTAAVNT